MTIEMDPDSRKRMIASLRRYFEQQHDEELTELRAGLLLDFCLEEICPTVYNRAIADAQAWMVGRVEDLEGSLFEPEFDYWRR